MAPLAPSGNPTSLDANSNAPFDLKAAPLTADEVSWRELKAVIEAKSRLSDAMTSLPKAVRAQVFATLYDEGVFDHLDSSEERLGREVDIALLAQFESSGKVEFDFSEYHHLFAINALIARAETESSLEKLRLALFKGLNDLNKERHKEVGLILTQEGVFTAIKDRISEFKRAETKREVAQLNEEEERAERSEEHAGRKRNRPGRLQRSRQRGANAA